jgi:hypothetical protein
VPIYSWLHQNDSTGLLQHARARSDTKGITVVLFVLAPNLAEAEAGAQALLSRSTGKGPLAGWHLATCSADLITPAFDELMNTPPHEPPDGTEG